MRDGDVILIRRAFWEDLPAIEAMQHASVRSLNGKDYSAEQIHGFLKYFGRIDEQLIEEQSFFVVEISGDIVGSGAWSECSMKLRRLCGLEGADCSGESRAGVIDIRSVFVHPRWTRRGIGSLLMKVLEARAQAAGYHRADVIATMTGLPLYRALGYRELARPDITLPNGLKLPSVYLQKRLARLH
ncbi:MAG: GNAT family N-acetyltransferase [Kiloniellales bacterium]